MATHTHHYQRHRPEDTILYKVVAEHAEHFFDVVASDPDRKPLPTFVKREFDKFLACGLLSEGCVRLKCDQCPESIFLAFSCKCRGFCPSCAGRRMAERSINLSDRIIPYVPTRHWVLSLPFELRFWMASDDRLLKKVNKILCDEIRNYLRKKARKKGIRGGDIGVASFLQRAGGALNLNLHFHLLALDGIYTQLDDGHLVFHPLTAMKDDELAQVIRGLSRRVIKYLREIGRIPPDGEEYSLIDGDTADSHDQDQILSQIRIASISSRIALGPRTGQTVRRIGRTFGYEEEIPKFGGYGCVSMNGFSIHAATTIKAHERDQLEKLLRYLGRGPIANNRITLDEHGDILYELKNAYDGATHVKLSPLELVEKIASIIPPPYKHQVNYYGCLSSNHKLRPLIIRTASPHDFPDTGAPAQDQESRVGRVNNENKKPNNSSYIPWAELLKRTFQIDLSVCGRCEGPVRVVAAIIKREELEKILNHLGLATGPPKPKKNRPPEYVYESFG